MEARGRGAHFSGGRQQPGTSTDGPGRSNDSELDRERRPASHAEVRRAHGVWVVRSANRRVRHQLVRQLRGCAVRARACRRNARRPLASAGARQPRRVQRPPGVLEGWGAHVVAADEPASRRHRNRARLRVALPGPGRWIGPGVARRTRNQSRSPRRLSRSRQHGPARHGVQPGRQAAGRDRRSRRASANAARRPPR